MSITLVIDVGNFSTKYSYRKDKEIKCGSFSSVIHPYKELDNEDGLNRFEYNNLDYFVGEETKNFYSGKEESMYFGNIKKGHHESQIRLVSALYYVYKETGEREFNLVLTSPYESMISDKDYFLNNFQGKKSSRVDGNPFEFEVKKIVMAAEGLGALHFSEELNCSIVDAGSMTTNVLYLINGSISREDSITINGGTLNNSPFQIANNIAKHCPFIAYDYPIICSGGQDDEIKTSLEQLGYEKVESPNTEVYPNYYTNSVGLLLRYEDSFEEMFK